MDGDGDGTASGIDAAAAAAHEETSTVVVSTGPAPLDRAVDEVGGPADEPPYRAVGRWEQDGTWSAGSSGN